MVERRRRQCRNTGIVSSVSPDTRRRASDAPPFEATPLIRAPTLSSERRDVWLKDETVLPTGSFKVRGAWAALTAELGRTTVREVVAASTGNHGAAVAWVARELGVPAHIFVPRGANPVKTGRIRDLGATLVEDGHDLTDAIDAATEYIRHSNAFFLHDASNADVPVGTATIATELLDQCPSLGTIYVPMGDTALIRGVASVLKRSGRAVTVVGVVSTQAPAYARSWRAGQVVETPTADTMADGLAVRRPLAPNVSAIRELVDHVIEVTESALLDAVAWLEAREHIVAEPSGAASVAALIKDSGRSGTLVALVTGRNRAPLRIVPSSTPQRSISLSSDSE